MNTEQAKQELIRRYEYLYKNAYFILAPFMYEQSENEFLKMKDEFLRKYNMASSFDKPLIYLNINKLDRINSVFEEFLLSDKPMEESELYKVVESKRNDKSYLDAVKIGLELVEKENARYSFHKLKLDIKSILSNAASYIIEQTGDLKNKKRKMKIIREYRKIADYQNKENLPSKSYFGGDMVIPKNYVKKALRTTDDVGVKSNAFILVLANTPLHDDNDSILTENEKQAIYLKFHDELPWDLEIECKLEEEYTDSCSESRLQRPENIKPCGNVFFIKEENIFVNHNETAYRYYQLCPHCGYIVNIPKEILSVGIRKRIEDRCSKDNNLFRKNFLYSELFSLDSLSTEGQKRLLKK